MERERVACKYLTGLGYAYNSFWQTPWVVKEKPGYFEIMAVDERPPASEHDHAGEVIREPEYSFEIGCRAHHPEWSDDDDNSFVSQLE